MPRARFSSPAVAAALAVVAAATAGLSPSPATAAGAGVVSGTLGSVPSRVSGAVVIEAVDANSGRVRGVAKAAPSGAFRLTVPAGTYVLRARAQTASGRSLTALTHALRVRSGARRVISPRLRAATATAAGHSGRAARASAHATVQAHAAAVATGSVFAVHDVLLDAAPGARIPNLRLDPAILTAMFDPCAAQGMRFVDDSPKMQRWLEQEEALSQAGRSDTPVHYQPLTPQYTVTGEATASANGETTIILNVVDSTGGIVARETVSGRTRDLDDIIAEVVDRLAQDACGAPPGTPCRGTSLICRVITHGTVAAHQTANGTDGCGVHQVDVTETGSFNGFSGDDGRPGPDPPPDKFQFNGRTDAHEYCQLVYYGPDCVNARVNGLAVPDISITPVDARTSLVTIAPWRGLTDVCRFRPMSLQEVLPAFTVHLRLKVGTHPRHRTLIRRLPSSLNLRCSFNDDGAKVGCRIHYSMNGTVTVQGYW